MTIVYLSASGRVGGAERALLDLMASVRAARPDWALHLIVAGDGPLAERAAALGATVHRLAMPRLLETLGDAGGGSRAALLARVLAAGPRGMLWIRRLRRLLREIGAEVVHTNGFKMHVAAALAMPARGRLVWHVHDYVSARRVMASALRRLAKRPAAAVAVSRSVAEDVRRVCGDGLRIETVYNAVDLDRFTPDGDRIALHELAGMAPEAAGSVTVGLVATMGLWKGHDVFLRAISLIPRNLPVRAYVVGGRIYATTGSEVDPEALREMARTLGIADRVGFTGFVEDAAAVMRSLDVVVHASTQPEPFGLVIAEAMACGRAVVVSAAGGAAEIVADGTDALAVPPGDAEAMAAAIRAMVEDADLRARLGAAARVRAERDFDRARLAREMVPIYQSLVD
jgi:glycosyltransferase involved in cell wall biosynthesis